MLAPLLASLAVPRLGPGRPRTTPAALLGDKAYSARAHRAHLRGRGVTTVVPEPGDQVAHRERRGSAGGRPVNFDKVLYKRRNVVERCFNRFKNWRAVATRYDKHAVIYRGGLLVAAVLLWLRD
jgi:transposase